MLHKLSGLHAFPTFNDPRAAALGTPQFDQVSKRSMGMAFGRPGFEKTASGHFYSDNHKMPAAKGPMMEMCHSEDYDGFADHIISTPANFFGELD